MEAVLTKLPLKSEECFSLAQTLDCGQCFRWQLQGDGSWSGIVGHAFCRVWAEDGALVLESNADNTFWSDYFDLSRSYAQIRWQLSLDPILSSATAFAPGIRVLKQPPWETLCTFIISQNNHIPRIRGIVERLCACFGEEIFPGGFSFPPAEVLARKSPEDLSPLRAGFRVPYLLDAARKVAGGAVDLSALSALPLDEARKSLQTIHGVGPKVAECTLLYGCGRVECLPLDVWMKRVMKEWFPMGLPDYAKPVAGIAQQYLFHYARLGPHGCSFS